MTAVTHSSSKKHLIFYSIISVLLIISLGLNMYLYSRISKVETQLDQVQQEVADSREANEQVLEMLKEVRNVQEKQNKALEITMRCKSNEKYIKQMGFTKYTDLGSHSNISVATMNKIIDYYDSKVHGGTPFKGKGEAFCRAADETGLNPIYLFAHACVESSYGNSYLGVTKNNYFGINAVDTDPGRADVMGDSVDAGIVNGAKWIKSNFYDNGYTTLADMQQGGYASDPKWADVIESIIADEATLI